MNSLYRQKLSINLRHGRRRCCWWDRGCRTNHCECDGRLRQPQSVCALKKSKLVYASYSTFQVQSADNCEHIVTTPDAKLHHLVANYDDADDIESVLRGNSIDVVVSALVLLNTEAARSQINLIRGAAQSGTVTKFIPSEYHLNFHAPIK